MKPKKPATTFCKKCPAVASIKGHCKPCWAAYCKANRMARKARQSASSALPDSADATSTELTEDQKREIRWRDADMQLTFYTLCQKMQPSDLGKEEIEALFSLVIRANRLFIQNNLGNMEPNLDLHAYCLPDALYGLDEFLKSYPAFGPRNPNNYYYREAFQPWDKALYGIPMSYDEAKHAIAYYGGKIPFGGAINVEYDPELPAEQIEALHAELVALMVP